MGAHSQGCVSSSALCRHCGKTEREKTNQIVQTREPRGTVRSKKVIIFRFPSDVVDLICANIIHINNQLGSWLDKTQPKGCPNKIILCMLQCLVWDVFKQVIGTVTEVCESFRLRWMRIFLPVHLSCRQEVFFSAFLYLVTQRSFILIFIVYSHMYISGNLFRWCGFIEDHLP